MPHDLPPWAAIYQQVQRWLPAGCFEALFDHLCAVLRTALGRAGQPSAAILDSRTLRSWPESGTRAGHDGAERKEGSKLHVAIGYVGNLLAVHVTHANVDDRAEVARMVKRVHAVTEGAVDAAFADLRYSGEKAAEAAAAERVELVVARVPEAKKDFALLLRRGVAERSVAWMTRVCRRVRDYQRYASRLAGWHLLAFVCLLLRRAVLLATGS